MTLRISILFILLSSGLFAQESLLGLWQGIIVRTGMSINSGSPFFINVIQEESRVSGQIREEVNNTDFFAIAKYYGTIKDSNITFKQVVYQKKEGNSRITWCKLEGDLTYNSMTGYLEGTFKSTDCRKSSGKIILYRSNGVFSDNNVRIASQSAKDNLIKDLLKGRPAPVIRDIQRKNFIFEPIYFDYDMADIRQEHEAFLLRVIEIVDGHSDLRVRVIGNTDSDGTDQYNDKLSRRRAQAIIDFFVQYGIKADRIEIQFNGERVPVELNSTDDGKQKNRRVEFEFI